MAIDVNTIIEQLDSMSVRDLVQLSQALQDKWGVSAAPVMAAGAVAAAPAGGEAPAAAEEKTEFTVTLTEVGPNKINVIKAVRELTSLGLKEAKELVDSAPKPVVENVSKDAAAAAQTKLQDAGAKAAIA